MCFNKQNDEHANLLEIYSDEKSTIKDAYQQYSIQVNN